MKLFIDIGNTNTKWILTENSSTLDTFKRCYNQDIANSQLVNDAKLASEIWVANVAGEAIEKKLTEIIGKNSAIQFAQPSKQACNVINEYDDVRLLGVDRWLALIAAFELKQSTCLVVNAGTAITIDALRVTNQQAHFIGGTIAPGLQMMRVMLNQQTAQLKLEAGEMQDFPINSQNAIYTGCLQAALGAIQLQWQKLYDMTKMPHTLLLSGGDAEVLYKYLPADLAKHAIIVDNLVLRGLMRLERDKA